MNRLVLLAALFAAATPAAAQDVTRAITPIAGDVYRFQNNFHVSVFVVTEDGVIVTDPINAEAAAWLKGEIGKMTDKPITHLIYSHSHGDHASGGAAFGDGLTVAAHANAPEAIDGVAPNLRFDDVMSLDIGGKTVELTYLGPGHGNDLIAMVVRPENVAFVVDAVSVKRLPYRDMPGADVGGIITQIEAVDALDFDTLVGGHGPVGGKADVADQHAYLTELRDQVLAGLKAGKTVEELQAEITMDAYKDWSSYEQWRTLNIEGMARWLKESGQV